MRNDPKEQRNLIAEAKHRDQVMSPQAALLTPVS